jgi:Acetyltransferases, including N-acetylases of ribosomal proteins
MREIETPRLVMDKITLADTRTVFSQSLEPSRAKGIPNEVYETFEEAEKIVRLIQSHYEAGDLPYVLAIRLKDTREMVGHISASTIQKGVEIGYAIGEKHQGHGYATEAVMAFTNVAKERYGLEVLYGEVLPDNCASVKVLEKAGYRFVSAGERYLSYCK